MFHAQYMLALGHYEQATNELAKAMTMMEIMTINLRIFIPTHLQPRGSEQYPL